ncbi:MAG: hypothetical protein V1492_02000 [Candidatus Micrarchaeota archaeon]
MLKVPVVYLKDKQAFEKRTGAMRLLGSAVEVVKKLGKKHELVHLIDLELQKGSMANFDTYDKLTYFTHIQVECEDRIAVERLLALKARVVVQLPSKLPLEKYNKKLLVGIASGTEDASAVGDVLLENPSIAKIALYEKQGKRIMLHEKEWDKKTKVWALIL